MSRVQIVEVGPRDGLQNEPANVPLDVKVALVDRLAAAGLVRIEAGAFVSPKRVPRMADSSSVFAAIRRRAGVRYSALVPNAHGLAGAIAANADEVAIFAAASETFSRRNIAASIAESFSRFEPVADGARASGLPLRGYLSCVLGCPYEGAVDPARVAELAARLIALGCHEVSLGDTIGVGTATAARSLVRRVAAGVPVEKLALHCHDTYGQAIANIAAGLEEGVRVIDASVAGLGGCPFAKGATGNVATEDVLYLLEGLGVAPAIDADRLAEIGQWISDRLGRPNGSKAGRARLAARS